MIYEVVLTSTMANQVFINRFNYFRSGTSTGVLGSFALLTAMGFVPTGGTPPYPSNTLFSALRALTSTSLQFLRVIARAVKNYDVTDFYEVPFLTDTRGLVGGEQTAPFLAFGFKSNRARLDIGRAYKRFPGVPESFSGASGYLTSDALTAAGAVATRMAQILQYAGQPEPSFVPIVVKKEKITDPETGRVTYQYYENYEKQVQNSASISTWEVYPTVRHQTSRQYGRGI